MRTTGAVLGDVDEDVSTRGVWVVVFGKALGAAPEVAGGVTAGAGPCAVAPVPAVSATVGDGTVAGVLGVVAGGSAGDDGDGDGSGSDGLSAIERRYPPD